MSLNRTLDRFLTEIRREARRNPAFAERLDGVFRAHRSLREASEEDLGTIVAQTQTETESETATETEAAPAPAALPNPVGLLQKEGEAALRAVLDAKGVSAEALRGLIAEHNLDPAGQAEGALKPALIDLIAASAQRRIDRDKKLFDY
jgi:hypothetical protein